MAAHSPRWLRWHAHAVLDKWLPVNHKKVGLPEKLRRFSKALDHDFARAHAAWRDIFGADELTGLLRPEWRHDGQPPARRDLFEDYFAAHFEAVAGCDPLDQATYVDIKTWLPDGVLVKADRTSMAHSLEVRCPLLDYRIVEFAAQLPPQMKLRGFSKKFLLKPSQRARLPAWLLERAQTRLQCAGFALDLGALRPL